MRLLIGIVLLTSLAPNARAGAAERAAVELHTGARVQAKGRFEDGRLVAMRLRAKDPRDRDLELEGPVSARSPDGAELDLLGVRVRPDVSALDRRSLRHARAALPGDRLRVEGHLDREGVLEADDVAKADADGFEAVVEGIVRAVARASGATWLHVGTIRIEVTDATELGSLEWGGER